jgi:HipA-like protein
MTKLSRFFDSLRKQFGTWAGAWPRANAGAAPGTRVYVQAPIEGTTQLRTIGVLWQEDGFFRFKYDHAFVASEDAEPILAFPELRTEYVSRDLWPFFAVRIPPPDREDVRQALERLQLRPDQTLEILGKLARRSISNAYRFDLTPTPAPKSSSPSQAPREGAAGHAAS